MSDCSRVDRVAMLVASDLPDNPPKGFVELPAVGPFDSLMGKLYGRRENEDMVMGFRCSPRHINAHNTCHGGMIASFADMVAYSMRVQAGLRETSTPTVMLSIEYLRPISLGDWVEGHCEVVKKGKRLLFSRVTGKVDGETVFTATSINVPGAKDIPGREGLDRVMGDQ